MSLSPFLRTPFTDLTGSLINHQQYDKCGVFEMQVMDCLEAYGTERGKTKCQALIEDFRECVGMKKQLLRFNAMRIERHKQWIMGQSKEHYAPGPKVDAY